MRRPYCSRSLQMRQELHQAKRWTRYSTYTRRLMERGDEVKTVTFDETEWQLVPRSSTLEMDRELVWGGDSGEEKWTAALATAPQHESQWQPDTIKIPRPEGHDSWSIEIKTSYGGGGGVGAKVGNYVGGGGGGSCPDTGETTSPSVADLP